MTSKAVLPAVDQVFDVPYPFVRATFTAHDMDEEGWSERDEPTWQPGTRCEDGDCEWVADAMGGQLLTVVSVHKPSTRYQARVFYTRQWRDPDGKVFGKGKLRIIALNTFVRLTRGFRYRFKLRGAAPTVAAVSPIEARH